MGKTDIRDADSIARDYPRVGYRAFDLKEAGPDWVGQMLPRAVALLAAGELAPLPVRAWDVRRAREAFRFMSQARHTGKIVLTIPPDSAAPREPGRCWSPAGPGRWAGWWRGIWPGPGGPRELVLTSRSGSGRGRGGGAGRGAGGGRGRGAGGGV